MLMSMYTLFFRYRCVYMHFGYFGGWFWILNLSQAEQVFTQYSRLFSFLSKPEGGWQRAPQDSELGLLFSLCFTDGSSFGTLLKPKLNSANLLTFKINTQWGQTLISKQITVPSGT